MVEKKITTRANEHLEQASFIYSLRFKISLGIILFILIVLLANYFVIHTRGKEVISEQADKLNHEVGKIIQLKLRERLAATESLADSLATLGMVLPKKVQTFHQVIPKIINQAGMEKIIAGGGIWPEPGVFESGIDRHSFFWGRDETGKLKFFNDYNLLSGKGYHHEEWYVPARHLKPGQVYWSKSYMDPYSLEPMVTCTMPMWQGAEFKGVVTVDLKLTGLSEFMSEQAELIGGYAFAVDRNDRLLSFPNMSNEMLVSISSKRFTQSEYPTIHELAVLDPEFSSIAQRIMQIGLASINEHQTSELADLSKQLAADSYQIDEHEAMGIAAILLGYVDTEMNDKQYVFPSDPILKEETSVSVLAMPDIGWKVIISMPARYANDVVTKITFRMLSLLFVLLSVTAFAYFLFINATFLAPIKKLTYQIRKLVSRDDYITRLDVLGNNELSQLASWFNIRTKQLADVLERLKSKNIDLVEAREIAEQANRSKNLFLASMSHDIRTPMNGIIGMSEFLTISKLNSEQENYVRVIHSSAQALLSLINDIMDYSKIDANKLDLVELPFDLREVIDDCADLLAYQTSEKKVELVYYLSPEINRFLIGDSNRIRQVIVNLTSNAVKFTSTGRVELWLEATYQSERNTQLLIEVRDTGTGLSQSAKQNLFSPFVQGDSTSTRKYGGTGLGLAICKHLSEMMGGSIDYRSEEGVGTTFVFKLKLKSDINAKRVNTLNMLKNQTVIILGQNHLQNSVIEQYVSSMGFQFETVPNLPAWSVAQKNVTNSAGIAICADPGLLGDFSQLSSWLAERPDHHLIILNSYDDSEGELATRLPESQAVHILSSPLKYDELKKVLFVCSELEAKSETFSEPKDLESDQSHGLAPLEFLSKKHILMIEDNQVNQQVLMIMLNNLGLSADVAVDGVEGVDAATKKDYDLILMDWQMPRMDGLEATRKIRAIQGSHTPKIVAVTANAMSGDVEKCLEAGMDDYLSKPVQKNELESMIRKWLML